MRSRKNKRGTEKKIAAAEYEIKTKSVWNFLTFGVSAEVAVILPPLFLKSVSGGVTTCIQKVRAYFVRLLNRHKNTSEARGHPWPLAWTICSDSLSFFFSFFVTWCGCVYLECFLRVIVAYSVALLIVFALWKVAEYFLVGRHHRFDEERLTIVPLMSKSHDNWNRP